MNVNTIQATFKKKLVKLKEMKKRKAQAHERQKIIATCDRRFQLLNRKLKAKKKKKLLLKALATRGLVKWKRVQKKKK